MPVKKEKPKAKAKNKAKKQKKAKKPVNNISMGEVYHALKRAKSPEEKQAAMNLAKEYKRRTKRFSSAIEQAFMKAFEG